MPERYGTVCRFVALGDVAVEQSLRLEVDFNYGSREAVCLYPKSGHRRGFKPSIEVQFQAAGMKPHDGLAVVLFEPRCDLDDDGVVCDLEVAGILRKTDEGRWIATFHEGDRKWVPSVSN